MWTMRSTHSAVFSWLGFIGNEYKAERKILLRNLAGSSAFRSGQPKEVEMYANNL